ncbi:hypothetical protein HPP92_028947 [Vanilla planifolia]|uniref:Uncharacterized protein n=1 Tax=Vanilla planifolia TaxID=51239 RepID=A0A835U1R4_VANPL|nr:hypothetical protein HPP92_028937 [Vanilla planifolia]KAG0446244.1 hypothetical protein HPP92_028947 [Vanilla planifolia]
MDGPELARLPKSTKEDPSPRPQDPAAGSFLKANLERWFEEGMENRLVTVLDKTTAHKEVLQKHMILEGPGGLTLAVTRRRFILLCSIREELQAKGTTKMQLRNVYLNDEEAISDVMKQYEEQQFGMKLSKEDVLQKHNKPWRRYRQMT